jgi:hypothetical protein
MQPQQHWDMAAGALRIGLEVEEGGKEAVRHAVDAFGIH